MFKKLLILPAAALAFACSKGDKQTAADSALNSDLSTAAASRPYTPLDSITAAERAGTATAPAALRSNANAAAPRTVYRAPVRRTTTRRSSSSSGGTYSSAPAPAPAPTVVKHTKRDAAIGAGAGAVIGAVTSKDKVKGAIIGGAAGAILGGIIGNNVDKTKK
jgi:hypothetical protein